MPGPESPTATRVPPVRLCSVLIDNTRLASAEIAASTALRMSWDYLLELNMIASTGSNSVMRSSSGRDSILDHCVSPGFPACRRPRALSLADETSTPPSIPGTGSPMRRAENRRNAQREFTVSVTLLKAQRTSGTIPSLSKSHCGLIERGDFAK